MVLLAYRAIASKRFDAWAPHILLAVCVSLALPYLLIRGGVNSEFAPLVPLFPFYGLLLNGFRSAIWIAVCSAVVLLLTVVYADSLPGAQDVSWSDGKANARVMLLMLALVTSTFFVYYIEQTFTALQQQLHQQATEDPLTGLANRRAFKERMSVALQQRTRHGEPLSLLILDVDHFKRLNDSHGHAMGDEYLQLLAQALRANTRDGQDLVARFGGEEFVILMEQTQASGALRVAELIRTTVAELRLSDLPESHAPLTVTIGCATANRDVPTTADMLFKQADAALYRGKAAGRNRVVAQPQPNLGPSSNWQPA